MQRWFPGLVNVSVSPDLTLQVSPAEQTNKFKWFNNKAVRTLCLVALQSSQSTATYLSYSARSPKCHM